MTSPNTQIAVRPTHVESLRHQLAATKQQVLKLLGWSILKYAQFMEAQGIAYLHHAFGTECPLIDRVPEHKEFWSWWKLHWMKREQEFLELSTMLFPSELESYYTELHQPQNIKHTPQAEILEASYEKMMHGLVKSVSKEVSCGK